MVGDGGKFGLVRVPVEIWDGEIRQGYFSHWNLERFYRRLINLFAERDPYEIGEMFIWKWTVQGWDFWKGAKDIDDWEEFKRHPAHGMLAEALNRMYELEDKEVDIKEFL